MRRGTAALAAMAIVAAALAIAFAWQRGVASLYDDSVSYLVMAQALSPWEATPAPIAAAWPDQRYPPLFPLLLGVAGGAYDWRLAHAWVGLAFGAGVFLLGILGRGVTRSALVGAVAALLFACMPGAWLNVKGILTEFPYIALSLAALIAYRRCAERPTRPAFALVSVLLAAAILMRTIGVALLAAVAIAEGWRYLRGRDPVRLRGFAIACAGALALVAAWYVARPRGGEDAYVSFSASVAQNTAEHGAAWLASLVASNVSAMVDAWLTALLVFWGEPWKPGFMIACIVGASGVAGTLWRTARGEADAIYVVAFVAILAAWPFPGQMYRLALPAIPLVALNALSLWEALLARRMEGARAARWTAIAAGAPLLIAVLAAYAYIAGRAHVPAALEAAGYRARDIAEFYRVPFLPSAYATALGEIDVIADLERVRSTTPGTAAVMWYRPEYVALFARRRGIELENPADAAGAARQIAAKMPDYVYLSAVHPRDTAHRQGDPMASLEVARRYGREVWRRDDGHGGTAAALFAIDPARILRQ
ncbi:MAG TPA: hypothetical protein VH040_01720 [Usitatibacter sp.]|jgi:hypothetical protein|nr:hypothetical protein [Usitatibacter sp.]